MRLAPAFIAGVLLLAACTGDDSSPAVTTTTSTPGATTTTEGSDAAPPAIGFDRLEVIATGLDVPWEVAFVDETTFLVTERTGAIRVVEDGALRDEPAVVLDAVTQGEGGVLGMALHPDFPDEASAFVYYTADDGNQVSRFAVADDLDLSGEEVVLEGIPAAPNHDGGRIAFGPDGHLYVTTGDAGEPDAAADLDSLAGKILRITTDGDVPDDNPFDDSPVWSYGHRNPQGLAWTSDGALYATEHGPSGDLGLRANDEVNRIEPGGFYGWPFVAGTASTGQGDPPAEPIAPVAASGDDTTWAPSGIAVAIYDGAEQLLFTGLRGTALYRVDPAGGDVTIILDNLGRLRIATVGPDDCLYLGTSNTDGRGDPTPDDDRILRAC